MKKLIGSLLAATLILPSVGAVAEEAVSDNQEAAISNGEYVKDETIPFKTYRYVSKEVTEEVVIQKGQLGLKTGDKVTKEPVSEVVYYPAKEKAFEVEYHDNPSLKEGEEKVIQEGKPTLIDPEGYGEDPKPEGRIEDGRHLADRPDQGEQAPGEKVLEAGQAKIIERGTRKVESTTKAPETTTKVPETTTKAPEKETTTKAAETTKAKTDDKSKIVDTGFTSLTGVSAVLAMLGGGVLVGRRKE